MWVFVLKGYFELVGWRLAVGGWRLAVGGWRLAVGGRLPHYFESCRIVKPVIIELTELSCVAHALAQYLYFAIYQTD